MTDFKEMFGWDLVFRLIEKDIKTKEDVLVALIHWYLIKNGFKCLGTGNETSLGDSEVGSEALPEDWNKNSSYALRYTYRDKLYILRGVITEGDIVFNMFLVPDLSVSKVLFNVNDTVENLKGSIDKLIPTYKDVLDTLQKDLLKPVFEGLNKEATTQTAPPPKPPSEGFINQPPYVPRQEFLIDRDPEALSQVGRSDLDPFGPLRTIGPVGGPIGGGMLFDPFGRRGGPLVPEGPPGMPGVLPRGAVPPGARFDPFGPPGLEPRGGQPGRGPGRGGFGVPDPDHLPPPGYDDMFM